MTLNASGPISIGGSTAGQSINLELGRAAGAQSSMGETSLRTLAGVASGPIDLQDFYGKSNFSPTTVTYNSGSGTETAPAGATSCRIRIWGGGGGGGKSFGGGGGGGFSEKTVSVVAGDQINYVVGAAGTGRTANSTGTGTDGGQSRVGDVTATGGFAGTNMSANGGSAGGDSAGGAGGSASGGSTNTTGNAGVAAAGAADGGGDAAGTGGGDGGTNAQATYDPETLTWITDVSPTAGSSPGGGGGGGFYTTIGGGYNVSARSGAAGRVEFYYT